MQIMDAQQFKDAYMQKLFKSEGPETAAVLKTMKPGSTSFVYDPQRVDLPRVGADEVVVPITKFGPGTSTGKPRRVGSTGLPTYTGGVPASMFPGQTGTPETWREMGVSEEYINQLIPGNIPAYIDEYDKDGARIIDAYNETGARPGVILR